MDLQALRALRFRVPRRGVLRWGRRLLLVALPALGGCRAREALLDGVYTGLSDTVAGVLSSVLLRGLESASAL